LERVREEQQLVYEYVVQVAIKTCSSTAVKRGPQAACLHGCRLGIQTIVRTACVRRAASSSDRRQPACMDAVSASSASGHRFPLFPFSPPQPRQPADLSSSVETCVNLVSWYGFWLVDEATLILRS
jgi:hypothetical protein